MITLESHFLPNWSYKNTFLCNNSFYRQLQLISRVADCNSYSTNPALIQPKNGFNRVGFLGHNPIPVATQKFNPVEFLGYKPILLATKIFF